jgi:hypothetical protein
LFYAQECIFDRPFVREVNVLVYQCGPIILSIGTDFQSHIEVCHSRPVYKVISSHSGWLLLRYEGCKTVFLYGKTLICGAHKYIGNLLNQLGATCALDPRDYIPDAF